MPAGLARRYLDAMPRLEAEERLFDLTLALIATGRTKPHEVKRIRSQLDRMTRRPGQRRARHFTSIEGAETMGIRVIRES